MKYKSNWLASLLLPLLLLTGTSEAKLQPMAGNGLHSLYIDGPDRTVYASGWSESGQLGPAVVPSLNTVQFTAISTGIINAQAVASSITGSLVLMNDGTVYYFGRTATGAPGPTPVMVPGSGYSDIAITTTSVYLLRGGQVYAWGFDPAIQPTEVTGLTNIQAIDGSYYHMVALNYSGQVFTMGLNPRGQIGNGTTTAAAAPFTVIVPCLVKDISAGETTTAVACYDGSVYNWGAGSEGQLGNNTKLDSFVPTLAQITGAVAVQAGRSFTAAIKADGTMWAWGWHNYIRGSVYNQSLTPIQIVELVDVRFIGGCADHTMSLSGDGIYRNWSGNIYGKLSDGTNTERHAPVAIVYDPTVVPVTIGGIVASAPVVEPVAVEPVAVEPVAVEPVAVEPVAVEPVAVEPVAVEPVAVPATSTVRVHDDNGHGNDVGKYDPSNPGVSKDGVKGPAVNTTKAAKITVSTIVDNKGQKSVVMSNVR